jgi:hypothetical protein
MGGTATGGAIVAVATLYGSGGVTLALHSRQPIRGRLPRSAWRRWAKIV